MNVGPELAVSDYRTTVRMAVSKGEAGYRARRSNRVVPAPECTIAHPEVRRIVAELDLGKAAEVIVRVGARTGESLVIVDGQVVGDKAAYHEEVAGQRFQISAESFFQARPDGAEAMVEVVGALLGKSGSSLLDAYSGVGLFGATVAGHRLVTGVEWARSSVEDARHNYPSGGRVIRSKVEKYQPGPFDTVVADPARRGLDKGGVAVVDATGAARLVLVSCDPASLARDAGLLVDRGFALEGSTTIDLFGQTSHVETVSLFVR